MGRPPRIRDGSGALIEELLVEALAADLCDRARRPARTAYDPDSWVRAGAPSGGPPEGTERDWWRRHAREVIQWVREHTADLTVVTPRGMAGQLQELLNATSDLTTRWDRLYPSERANVDDAQRGLIEHLDRVSATRRALRGPFKITAGDTEPSPPAGQGAVPVDMPATPANPRPDLGRRVGSAAPGANADHRGVLASRAARAAALDEARTLMRDLEPGVDDLLAVADWLVTGSADVALAMGDASARHYMQHETARAAATGLAGPDAVRYAPTMAMHTTSDAPMTAAAARAALRRDQPSQGDTATCLLCGGTITYGEHGWADDDGDRTCTAIGIGARTWHQPHIIGRANDSDTDDPGGA